MPKVATNDQKERFIELRAKGKSFESIAEEIGISKPTLIEWAKKFKIEIANLKALEMESLQEQFYISWKKRVELISKQLEQVNKELEKRDLSEVATEKLVDMQSKLLDKLKQEQIEIHFKEEITSTQALDESIFGNEIRTWKPE